LIVGQADAIAEADDGSQVVFDWKSDVSPKEVTVQRTDSILFSISMQRRRVERSYTTLGRMDWVSNSR
jgi:hypothetical protein